MKLGWILLGVGVVGGGVIYLATRPKTTGSSPIPPPPTSADLAKFNSLATPAAVNADTIAVANAMAANGAPLSPDQINALAAQTLPPNSPSNAVLADALGKALWFGNAGQINAGVIYAGIAKNNGASPQQLAQLSSYYHL
jgi:hypothetical protein